MRAFYACFMKFCLALNSYKFSHKSRNKKIMRVQYRNLTDQKNGVFYHNKTVLYTNR